MSYRAFALVVCLVVTRSAYAEHRGLAVLVGSTEGDPIVLKISDELRALEFEVEVARHGSDRARIRQRANKADAVAVVLVDDREIEVRVVTAEQVHERRIPRRAADPGTSALAAVEVVRGYLVPVERGAKDAALPPPEPTATTPDQPRSWSARLSGGFMSAGSFPTQGAVTLGGAKHLGRLAIELSTVATIPRADAWTGGLDAGLQFSPLGFTRPVSFSVGIGATALVILYKEDGKKYTAEVAALPHVGAVVRAAINESVSARVDGRFGVSVPSPGFKTKTGSDIQFGSSVVAASAGLEVAW
ncbi:MAG TPA: hypothetical protein VIV11_02960 [Kofleriaceae bacterium]